MDAVAEAVCRDGHDRIAGAILDAIATITSELALRKITNGSRAETPYSWLATNLPAMRAPAIPSTTPTTVMPSAH